MISALAMTNADWVRRNVIGWRSKELQYLLLSYIISARAPPFRFPTPFFKGPVDRTLDKKSLS